MGNLADWMLNKGEIVEETHNSNFYASFDFYKVKWRSKYFDIQCVDGMVCRIDKSKRPFTLTEVKKIELIERCYKDVIKDISDCILDEFEGIERSPRTSEIIADYKSEAAEYYDIDEEEFDRLYKIEEELSAKEAMAYC